MKEKSLQLVKLFFSAAFLAAMLAFTPLKANATVLKTGSCGKSANYTYVREIGTDKKIHYVLYIGGSGPMADDIYDEDKHTYTSRLFEGFTITDLVIGNDITYIGVDNFSPYDERFVFTSLKIPSSCINIGEGAFDGVAALKTVSFPDTLQTINNCAFRGTGLTSVTIPASVVKMGEDAFGNCRSLTSISIKNSYVADHAFEFDSGQSKPITLSISSKCTSIGEDAFAGCHFKNNRVYIPSTVKKIGMYAFGYDIGDDPVYNKTNLTIVGANKSAAFYYAKKYNFTFITNGYKSVSLTKATNVKKRKIQLKWKRDKKASGYQIQYATSSTFSNYKNSYVTSNKTTSRTIGGLTKNKTYYVRMRCYKNVSGKKCYSEWSKVKTVKIKK